MSITETIPIPEFAYPASLPIWRTDLEPGQRLEILNDDDFPLADILESLAIQESPLVSSFGLRDPDEIQQRHEVVAWLLANPKLTDWLVRTDPEAALPDETSEFLRYFSLETFARRPCRSNPYWEYCRRLLAFIRSSTSVPGRIVTLEQFLSGSLLLEATERTLAERMCYYLVRSAVFESYGTQTFSLRLLRSDYETYGIGEGKKREEQFFGHRLFSPSGNHCPQIPLPTSRHSRGFLGFCENLLLTSLDLANQMFYHWATRCLVLTNPTDTICRTISRALEELLGSLRLSTDLIGDGLEVSYRYTYDQIGLTLQIVKINSPASVKKLAGEAEEFSGYSWRQRRLIQRGRREIVETIDAGARAYRTLQLRQALLKQNPRLFEARHVPAIEIDREMWCPNLGMLYDRPELTPAYQACLHHRQFFGEVFLRLREVARVVQNLSRTARRFGFPISLPTFVARDEHVVSFREIFPVHLIAHLSRLRGCQAQLIRGRKLMGVCRGDIQPIRSLADINSRMVAMTGHHEGGKTTTQLAILTQIYLAQSGLPVLGEAFRLNIKRLVGIVRLRGEIGSTVKVLMEKTQRILTALARPDFDGAETVVFIDEIGTGTQGCDGLAFGKRLLATLYSHGVSTMFGTQILELVVHACASHEALAFQIDRHHQIRPGIGPGGLPDLLREMQMDKLLK